MPAPRALLLLIALGAAPEAAAQETARSAPQWEMRLVAAATPAAGPLVGGGVNVRAGWYARVGVALAAGAARRDDAWRGRQDLELTARFLFDPYGQRPSGLYGGAGLGVRRDGSATSRGHLLLLAGIEGALAGSLVPAFEITIGGGVRAAVVLRRRREIGR